MKKRRRHAPRSPKRRSGDGGTGGRNQPTDDAVLDALRNSSAHGMRPKEVARHFGVKGSRYRELRDRLREMERQGKLLRLRGGRYGAPSGNRPTRQGVVSLIRSGAAFVSVGSGEPDVYVSEDDLGSALHGDKVEVSIEPARAGRRATGRVVRVVERNRDGMVGRVTGVPGGHRRPGARAPVVETTGPGPSRTLRIRSDHTAGANPGDMVVIRVTERGARNERMGGEIVEVLGPDSDPRTDSLRVIRQFGLSEEFPEDVIDDVERFRDDTIPDDPSRVDLSHLHVLTIDPADARDHDDALSVTDGPGDHLEVGVHIADVSYYVRPGSATDREALRRGTSTYLVDRAVPMLPELLSSEICSLKVGKDRRALSFFFRLRPDGTVVSTRLQRTWIRPREVLSYETAQGILDGVGTASDATLQSLQKLKDLAEILRIRRMNRGALDFDLPEAHVVLSPDGSPLAIRHRLRLESHRIIEEWMLAANEGVARRCRDEGIPVLFRIHDAPDPERTETLSALAATYGHTVPRRWSTRALQQLLDATRGEPEEAVIHSAVLRSMRRATYDPGADQHFGLAVQPYAHFTSPIRRYPDLHLHQTLGGTLLPELEPLDGEAPTSSVVAALDDLALHTTARERVADEAGRESVALARLRYMEGRIGDELSGVVSRAVPWGFFVALDEAFVEGLVHVRTLEDHFEYNESTGVLVGARTGLTFRDGDRVTIRVARVDRLERHIDFDLVSRHNGDHAEFDTPEGRRYRRPTDGKTRHSDR